VPRTRAGPQKPPASCLSLIALRIPAAAGRIHRSAAAGRISGPKVSPFGLEYPSPTFRIHPPTGRQLCRAAPRREASGRRPSAKIATNPTDMVPWSLKVPPGRQGRRGAAQIKKDVEGRCNIAFRMYFGVTCSGVVRAVWMWCVQCVSRDPVLRQTMGRVRPVHSHREGRENGHCVYVYRLAV